ncbi:BglG family transcription antiterminator [Macrococcus sp. DPC7161]|uniref:BglG family transcription antiterminator n=1 Tax=Macrococcus sp. DPC7161 TaxID=2507060 RepID=UPI00100BD72E|nr:BglG family transcription antiterminator [Macrococcus sp. DPC7161]RXK17422.1 PRD domain-containing protein [Macrococcus sp. DPC7161]
MQMSHREKNIIESLLKNPHSFLTIHHIAQNLGVSSRTIHRELVYVEETLARFNLQLERMTNKGLRITGDEADFELLIDTLASEKTIDLSVDERKVIILYTLIKAKDPVKLYSLANEVGISINKLNKEIGLLEADLNNYKLSLLKKRGEGLILVGEEVNRRQCLADIMLEKLNSTSVYSVIEDHFVYQTLNDEKLLDIDMHQIFNIERLLMDALIELPYVLTETAYLTLTIHIVLAIERIKSHEKVSIEQNLIDTLIPTKEFDVSCNLAKRIEEVYHITIDLEEKIFITMHLRGAKRKHSESKDMDLSLKTHELIRAVETYSNLKFNASQALYEGVLLHLGPALNRLEGGLETFNPLTEMIKTDYALIFNAVALSLEEVFPEYQFPEGEIAFVALHFGGSYRENTKLNVLVVCTSGIGTSRILSHKIEERFSNVEVVKEASVSELKSLDLNAYDHIISTVSLDIEHTHTVVNPLLPERDQTVLAQVFHAQPKKVNKSEVIDTNQYDDLMAYTIEGHQLIQSVYIETMDDDDYTSFIEKHLTKLKAIDNKKAFVDTLTAREQVQGFLITNTEIAIPHLVTDYIHQPVIILVTCNHHVKLKAMDQTYGKAKYLAFMFLPEHTQIRSLMSELSVLLMEHIDEPELIFSDSAFVTNHLKQSLLKYIKNQLN